MPIKVLPVSGVPELRLMHAPSLRLAPDIRVPLPSDIAEFVDHPIFQRLRGVRQLGFVDRVYPSATHSRFEHSLGVYYNALHYVHALWEDPVDSSFRDSMEDRELRALSVAALCHDLGQYPYSHILEDTERDANGILPNDSIFDHEAYTRKLLSIPEFGASVLAGCLPRPIELQTVFERLGISSYDVLSVLSGRDIGELRKGTSGVLHSIIDGPIDADKLDYLRRDSHHAGVNFGAAIDQHRFFQSLTIVDSASSFSARPQDGPANPDVAKEHQIAITEKGRVPAEEILIARWHMFTEVYWHRMTRAHESVLATAIRRLRPISEGFDAWFRSVVLRPTTTDEWFLELCRELAQASTRDASLGISATGAARIAAQKCHEMLASLAWSSGRAPYRRLISVSASDDADLYGTLQHLRNYAVEKHQPVLEELAIEVASKLHAALNVKVDPLDIVFDIPAKRAPANTVWVVSTNSPKRGSVSRLADRSAMWREFGESFHDRTRKIRLFCPAPTRVKIRESVSAPSEQLVIYDVLRESALKVAREAVQLELFAPRKA